MTIHVVPKITHFVCSYSTICTNYIPLYPNTTVTVNALHSNKNVHTFHQRVHLTHRTLLSFVKYSNYHLCQESSYKFHFTIMDTNAGTAAKNLNHIYWMTVALFAHPFHRVFDHGLLAACTKQQKKSAFTLTTTVIVMREWCTICTFVVTTHVGPLILLGQTENVSGSRVYSMAKVLLTQGISMNSHPYSSIATSSQM